MCCLARDRPARPNEATQGQRGRREDGGTYCLSAGVHVVHPSCCLGGLDDGHRLNGKLVGETFSGTVFHILMLVMSYLQARVAYVKPSRLNIKRQWDK
jgi:hypothetical protein